MFTTGYELTTGLTNLLILLVSLIGVFKIKNNKPWRLFYIFMSIDSTLSFIVHSFKISIQLNIVLWILLLIFFIMTLNSFLVVFFKLKPIYIILLTILLIGILILEVILDFNYIFTFDIFVFLTILLCLIKLIKNNYKNKTYYYLAFILSFISAVVAILNFELLVLNYNGISHIFIALTLLLFLIGIKKNSLE